MQSSTLPPRPTWLPPPPTALLRPELPRSGSRPRATLVSVAIGADFERKLQALGASARLGGFDDTLLWSSERDVLADQVLSTPLGHQRTFRDIFETSLRSGRFDARASRITKSFRPFCAAFKMVALWRALQQSREGDYVLWADASRYHANVTLEPGLLRGAIDLLRGASPLPPRPSHVSARWRASPWFSRRAREGGRARLDAGSAFGLLTCSGWDCESDLYTWNGQQQARSACPHVLLLRTAELLACRSQVINDVTRAAFAELLPSSSLSSPSSSSVSGPEEDREQLLLQRPLLLNSNILLRNTATRRAVKRGGGRRGEQHYEGRLLWPRPPMTL